MKPSISFPYYKSAVKLVLCLLPLIASGCSDEPNNTAHTTTSAASKEDLHTISPAAAPNIDLTDESPMIGSNDVFHELKADVTFRNQNITITNRNDFAWTYISLSINDAILHGPEYILHSPSSPYAPDRSGLEPRLKFLLPGETIILSAGDFATVAYDDDPPPKHFPARRGKIYQFTINCSVHSGKGLPDKGLWKGREISKNGTILFDEKAYTNLTTT